MQSPTKNSALQQRRLSGSHWTSINLDNTVLSARTGGSVSREVVFHGIQIHSAAQRIDASVEHREVVAAGSQKGVHSHTVADKLIDWYAIEFHAAVTDKLAAFLGCKVAGRGVEGVLVGKAIRHLQDAGERLEHAPLLLKQIIELLASQRLGHQRVAERLYGEGFAVGHHTVAFAGLD